MKIFVKILALQLTVFLLYGCATERAENSLGMNLVKIDPGEFTMGANPLHDWQSIGYEGPNWDESPPHTVKLTTAFYIADGEVTNRQYEEFDPEHSKYRGLNGYSAGDDDPVVFVTWFDAMAFCKWLSEKENKHYRLPTEAEWEYACRAGTTTPYYTGDSLPTADDVPPNAWGLYAMHEGVAEWCLDWWAPYTDKAQVNPVGPADGTVRILRGGEGGFSEMQYMRSANRKGTIPDDRYETLGFRVVMGKLPGKVYQTPPASSAVFENVSQEKEIWEAPPEEPYFKGAIRHFARPEDSMSIPYYNRTHVPTLTWCDNGDLLGSVFSAPFDKSRQKVMFISRLRAGNDIWDPPAIFFIAPDHNVGSAILHRMEGGEIHHYNGLASPGDVYAMIKRVSRDNGATWGPFHIVHERPENPAFLEFEKGAYKGTPRLWPHFDLIYFKDGSLIMPSDVGAGNESGTVLWKSNDNGDSWTELTRYGWHPEGYAVKGGEAGWIAGIHAPVVELNNGDLLAFGRHRNIAGQSPLSLSSDGGKTWTYSPSGFPPIYSGQQPVLKRLKDGSILLISYTAVTSSYREKTQKGIIIKDAKGQERRVYGMFSALSFDEGKTWKHKKLIPLDIENPYKADVWGYLSCIETPDGLIHLLSSDYYYCFNTLWLRGPMP